MCEERRAQAGGWWATADSQINLDLDVIIYKVFLKKASGLFLKLSSGQHKLMTAARLSLATPSGRVVTVHPRLTRGWPGFAPSHFLPGPREEHHHLLDSGEAKTPQEQRLEPSCPPWREEVAAAEGQDPGVSRRLPG